VKSKIIERNMGFGANLFFILIVMPLTIVWLVAKKNIYGKAVGWIWLEYQNA
jgi:hypothetical protein